jgi:hypothetical protein
MSCRVVTPPAADACGQPAMYIVTFGDDDKVKACESCALALRQLAMSHGTNVKIERIES